MTINFNKAEFVLSATTQNAFIRDGRPQVTFAGRSNVGKSSVINRLLNRKNFARVGATPGKTSQVNYFRIDGKLYFTDLPGYGYAKVSKSEKERWGAMMEEYFSQSQDLKVMLQLVDIRHEPTRDDVQMVNFLRDSGIPFVVAATKADKLSKAQRQRAVHLVARTLAVQPWEIIPWSSETGEGRDQLLKALQEHI